MIDDLSIEVNIDPAGGNVPMIHKSACEAEKIKTIEPYMRSALQQHEQKTDFLESWNTSEFSNSGVGSKQLNKGITSFGSRNVLKSQAITSLRFQCIISNDS